MKTIKVDRALAEVREWKDKANAEYSKLRELPEEEFAAAIKERVADIRKRHNLDLPQV